MKNRLHGPVREVLRAYLIHGGVRQFRDGRQEFQQLDMQRVEPAERNTWRTGRVAEASGRPRRTQFRQGVSRRTDSSNWNSRASRLSTCRSRKMREDLVSLEESRRLGHHRQELLQCLVALCVSRTRSDAVRLGAELHERKCRRPARGHSASSRARGRRQSHMGPVPSGRVKTRTSTSLATNNSSTSLVRRWPASSPSKTNVKESVKRLS